MTDARAALTIDDLLALRQVADAQIHPAGDLVAYVVADSVSEPRQQAAPSAIWIAGNEYEPRQVSAEGTRAHHPRWSPDGGRLAFLARRALDERDQLYLLDGGFGEARRLSDCPDGVSATAWAPDGRSLALLATDPSPESDEDREAGRDWTTFESLHRFTRIWRCDVDSGAVTPLCDADLQVWEIAWSPDGTTLAALVSDEPYNWAWYRARLVTIDVASGAVTPLRGARKQLTDPAWSPDGSRLAVISCTWSDQGMTGGDVIVVDRSGGAERNLTAGHPRSYLSAAWEPDGGRLLCAAIEDGEAELGYLSVDGAWEVFWRERASLLRWGTPFSRAADGTLAVVRSDPASPADVWLIRPEPERVASRVSDHNPWTRERQIATTEPVWWESFDGMRIQGLLVRTAEPGDRPRPTVVLVHGGPTSLWAYDFPGTRSMGWVQLLAAAGYAVFLPNPRGSMGFGTAFAEANIGDMGGGDWADVMAGIDHLVAAGIADPARLGLAGWSYGGYLTAWGVTQTKRFRAAVAGASITNWISFHGASTIPDFDAVFYASDPFDWDGRYGQFSPMAHVRNVETPTLFLHGEQDPICPAGQALEMFRALKELGVETELVIYPREGHGMRERAHARDVLERAVRWLSERV